MYIDEKSQVQKKYKKQQHSNQIIKSKKNKLIKTQLYHLNNHSFKIIHLDLATQMK